MFLPLNALTHGSHLFSQVKPEDLAKFAVEHDLPTIGLADLGNLSQCYHYHTAMCGVNKKPLLGMQLGICSDYASVHVSNETTKRLIIIARNEEGWRKLLAINFEANSPQNILGGPRLSIKEVVKFLDDNLVVIGHSDLSLEEWGALKGLAHLYCGINPVEGLTDNPLNLPELPILPNYFLHKKEVQINRLLLCKHFKIKLADANADVHKAFESDEFWMNLNYPFKDVHKNNALEVYDKIEFFELKRKEALPHFPCPKNLGEDEYLKQKCEAGLRELGLQNIPRYTDRLAYELSVINGAGMAGYFLVLSDITEFCRKNNILYGNGRGSAAGCLISYLVKITKVDPLKHNLIFERFYNPSRKEYPDIDLDIQPSKRSLLESYIRKKYGKDRFMQYATFGTLKGKAALKVALTTSRKNISPPEQDEITKLLPNEAKIEDELNEQNKQWGNKSTILWSLLNEPHVLQQWCTFDSENKVFDGPLAEEFELGINLNTIIQSRGRHASAFVLSTQPIHELVPVVWDSRSASYIIGVDMDAGQAMGLVKLDLLGLVLLDEFEYMKEFLS